MLDTIKDEIIRAYRVLGAEKAYMQNWIDIQGWIKQGYITQEQGKIASSFNRMLYKKEA